MATPKASQRALLADVLDKNVVRIWAGGYDWNNATGRDVTSQMRALDLAGLVALPPQERGQPTSRYRLTRAGHAEMAALKESA